MGELVGVVPGAPLRPVGAVSERDERSPPDVEGPGCGPHGDEPVEHVAQLGVDRHPQRLGRHRDRGDVGQDHDRPGSTVGQVVAGGERKGSGHGERHQAGEHTSH